MSKSETVKRLTRRSFASSAAGISAATAVFAGGENKAFTQASVPEDPAAPEVQQGTIAETLPFHGPLVFTS